MKLNDKQQCTLTFTHLNGLPATYNFQMNPLTGHWLQTHKVGEDESSYYGTKANAVSLAKSIVKKSKEKGLPCKVAITPRTTMRG